MGSSMAVSPVSVNAALEHLPTFLEQTAQKDPSAQLIRKMFSLIDPNGEPDACVRNGRNTGERSSAGLNTRTSSVAACKTLKSCHLPANRFAQDS
jgi:hypothetical protein